MSNVTSQNASLSSTHAGVTGDNYQVLNGYKTRVLTDEENKTRVFFHDTPVVSFNEETIELNTGGWRTRSTKVRMNQASQEFELGFRVFQKNDGWFVDYQNETQSFTTDTHVLNRIKVSQKGGEQNAQLV
jgi:hypothetical protein